MTKRTTITRKKGEKKRPQNREHHTRYSSISVVAFPKDRNPG